MANIDNLIVKVQPKLTVDLETAEVCTTLLNWFLEANDGYRLSLKLTEGKYEYVLTDEPITRELKVSTVPSSVAKD